MSLEEQKPMISSPQKSSMEILSELFGSFDAEPPIIVKKEKNAEQKKHKKKKKHKHKDKKHKKKSKKHKRSVSISSDNSGVDLTDILIKQEKEPSEEKLKTELMQKTLRKIIHNESVSKDKKEHTINETIDETHKIEEQGNKKDKIIIKDLRFSSIFDATIQAIKQQEEIKKNNEEEACECSENEKHEKVTKSTSKHKRKRHHNKSEEPKRKKHRSRSSSRECKRKSKSRSRSKTPDKNGYKNERHKHKERSDKYKDYKSKHDDRKQRDSDHRNRVRSSFKDKDDYEDHKKRSRDTFYNRDSSSEKEEKWFMRDRYRGYSDRDRVRRFREKSEESSTHIDKKKLLEIARKNAIQMMKSGSLPGALTLGPQAQEKVIAAIKSGGKTVEELTDFCKTLSKKEELGELSSISDDNVSESDSEKPFHHPFQIKERPVSITMNIKNSVPLPTKNLQERASELRMQFPVSSGQQHRKTESEWVPVSPKKAEPVTVPIVKQQPTNAIPLTSVPTIADISLPSQTKPLHDATPPPPPPLVAVQSPGVQVFPNSSSIDNIDIAAIVTQRLSAMRKLQENPNDVQALNSMYKAQKEMNTWAESKQQIGQFTGSTGAQILSQAELSSGYQAWARKDQLQTAAPLSGGMGMHLLQKMGWKPGEGLGKEKTGTLEPLLLEVKLDKKGIVAKEEQKKKAAKVIKTSTVKTLQGKHPVSLLGEYATKNKLGVPQYDLCFECGPDHKKNFLFRVILNDIEYKPQIASPNKKEAKANAALVCLQALGILPAPPLQPTE